MALQSLVSLTNNTHPVTFKMFPVCRAAANRDQRNCRKSRLLILELLRANGKRVRPRIISHSHGEAAINQKKKKEKKKRRV